MPEDARDARDNRGRTRFFFERLAEEHEEATRAAKQRRAGSRFRYRRRRQAAHHLRLAQDAHFPVFFLAALWFTFMAIGVSSPIGTIAFGTDTEGDRISVRTAVETGFPGSIVRTVSHAHYLRSTTLLDLTTATTSSRRAYATLCYYRPWLTFTHASLRPQQTCICPYIFTPATPATRLSLPTAHQLQPAPPITGDRPITRPACTDSSRLPARLRPAAPPACRSNCPGRLAWTRPSLGRTAQRLHTPCHSASHSTLYTLEESRKENYEKKIPTRILGCNNFFQEPGGGTCAQWHQLWTRADPVYASLVLQTLTPHDHRLLRADIHHGTSFVQQQIAPSQTRAGCRTAIRGIHA